MPWIETIDYPDSDGQLKEIYDKVMGRRGKLSNVMRIQSLLPGAMQAHLDLYMDLMFAESGLSREERELIGTVVSAVNRCSYCINHHAEALNACWKDRKRVDGLIERYENFELDSRSRTLADYAIKLTRTPDRVTESDIENLRNVGLSDRDILNANMIAGYFNFVNRLVMGLGVEFSPEEVKGYKY